MAARKKDPAVLRTVGLFTGRTPLEEAEEMALEEDELAARGDAGDRDIVAEAEEGAIKWLGLDMFKEGDDIKIAVHPKGHAVIVLVFANVRAGARSTCTFKLSRAQWSKLKQLVRES